MFSLIRRPARPSPAAAVVLSSSSSLSSPSSPPAAAAAAPAPAPAPPAPERPATTAGPEAVDTGGVVTVDLAAICSNWRSLANRVVPASCAAVIKADAYGCGVEPVATALAKAGCTTFFVAHLAEAARVRAAAPAAAVYVLNGIAPGSAARFAQIDARPVIGTMAEYVEWDAFRAASGWQGSAALHFDTGMNRLGFSRAEAPVFTTRVRMPGHGIALVMSHLACADTPQHPLNARQIEAFRDLRYLFRGVPASLANSSGIFLGAAAHCDLVRPGAALYGVNPTPGTANRMAPVVTVKARIVQVRSVVRGDTVGYGAQFEAAGPRRIAVVSAGYADGYLRAVGNANSARSAAVTSAAVRPAAAAVVVIAGRRCPLAGRVSMDLLAADVTAVPEAEVRRGDDAVLIGDGITVDDVAQWGGTIGYEVLTSLSRRSRREWLE